LRSAFFDLQTQVPLFPVKLDAALEGACRKGSAGEILELSYEHIDAALEIPGSVVMVERHGRYVEPQDREAGFFRKSAPDNFREVPESVAGIVHEEGIEEPPGPGDHELSETPRHPAGIGLEVPVARGKIIDALLQTPEDDRRKPEGVKKLNRGIERKAPNEGMTFRLDALQGIQKTSHA